MTNSCYDISHILNRGNELIVKARLFEGSYLDVTDGFGKTTNQFVREKLLAEPNINFNFFGVEESEMHDAVRAILSEYSDLPLIKEQA